MKTLSGTSLTSEMGWDKQMMDETLLTDFVTLQGDRVMSEFQINMGKMKKIDNQIMVLLVLQR